MRPGQIAGALKGAHYSRAAPRSRRPSIEHSNIKGRIDAKLLQQPRCVNTSSGQITPGKAVIPGEPDRLHVEITPAMGCCISTILSIPFPRVRARWNVPAWGLPLRPTGKKALRTGR